MAGTQSGHSTTQVSNTASQMVQLMNQNQGARITSTERNQNNNVSSQNPKKAIVTPRHNQNVKSFKGNNGPEIVTNDPSIYQKNLSHQINTQRNNYNPQVIYGASNSQNQYSAKHATGNLPLIRTESHDSKLKERDQPRFGALA